MTRHYKINIPCEEYMLKVPDLKKMLRKSERCIRNMLKHGVLPGVMVSGQWYVPRDALNQWLTGLLMDREKVAEIAGKQTKNQIAKTGDADPGGCSQSHPPNLKTVMGNLNAHELEK